MAIPSSLKCHSLPLLDDNTFFGREDILCSIEDHLNVTSEPNRPRTVVLHGPGGVGKSQIALAYAHRHLNEFDIALWVAAEDSRTAYKTFSDVAVNELKLPGARAGAHLHNAGIVTEWLRQTCWYY